VVRRVDDEVEGKPTIRDVEARPEAFAHFVDARKHFDRYASADVAGVVAVSVHRGLQILT
jgi:hypothetical protein